MKLLPIVCASVVALAFSQNAFAGSGVLTHVTIQEVSVIGATATGGHLPGNMEIQIKNGFTPQPGVSCVGNGASDHITTKSAIDPDRAMLHLLQAAVVNHRPVDLIITDDPANTAWGTRCSLLAVSLFW
jgi:hypothetical protein